MCVHTGTFDVSSKRPQCQSNKNERKDRNFIESSVSGNLVLHQLLSSLLLHGSAPPLLLHPLLLQLLLLLLNLPLVVLPGALLTRLPLGLLDGCWGTQCMHTPTHRVINHTAHVQTNAVINSDFCCQLIYIFFLIHFIYLTNIKNNKEQNIWHQHFVMSTLFPWFSNMGKTQTKMYYVLESQEES